MPLRTLAVAAAVILAFAAPGVADAAPQVAYAKAVAQTITGTGDSVPGVKPVTEPVIITLTHDGTGNFIVEPVGRDGVSHELWANEIGPWTGTTFQEMDTFGSSFGRKKPIVALAVTADGDWSAQIKPLSAAPRSSIKAGQGNGESVLRLSKAVTGLTRITLTHDGTRNFIVQAITASGDAGLLVNEIGPYSGTVLLPRGTQYLWVQADGHWTYTTR